MLSSPCTPSPRTPSDRDAHRTAARILVAAGFACAFSAICGCDHKAGAKAREPLIITVEGTPEERYGVEVIVMRGDRQLVAHPLGRDGRVEVPNAPSGEVRVTLRDLRGRFVTRSHLVPSPGEHALALVPGTLLRLTVLDARGNVLDPVRVVVRGGGDEPREFTLSGPHASLGPLSSGDFKLFVSSPGYETRILDLNVERTRTAGRLRDLPEVELSPGGATLRGKLDAGGRLGALRAFLRFGGGGQGIEIGADGSFILGGLPVRGEALEATLVIGDEDGDLLARRLRIAGNLNLGRIPLD